MSHFTPTENSTRPPGVQVLLYEIARNLDYLPMTVREDLSRCIMEATADELERRDLYKLLTSGDAVERVAVRGTTPGPKLRKLRRDVFERFLAREIRKQ